MKTREARKVICMELKNAIAIDGFELHNWYLNLDQFSLYNLVFMYVLHAKRLSRSTKSQHGSKINFTEEQDAKVGAWPAVHHSHDATNSNGDHHPLRTLQTPLRRGQAWLHLWHKPLLITFVVIQTVFFVLCHLWTRATYDAADCTFFTTSTVSIVCTLYLQ